MQWKKNCENEKKSKERNRELLKDFERVERHAAMLAVKSDRLRSYKVTSVLHYQGCKTFLSSRLIMNSTQLWN